MYNYKNMEELKCLSPLSEDEIKKHVKVLQVGSTHTYLIGKINVLERISDIQYLFDGRDAHVMSLEVMGEENIKQLPMINCKYLNLALQDKTSHIFWIVSNNELDRINEREHGDRILNRNNSCTHDCVLFDELSYFVRNGMTFVVDKGLNKHEEMSGIKISKGLSKSGLNITKYLKGLCTMTQDAGGKTKGYRLGRYKVVQHKGVMTRIRCLKGRSK